MPKKSKKASRRVQAVSAWEAMNQPVVEVSDEAAKTIFLTAAVILLAVWMMPYWGASTVQAYSTEQAWQVAGAEIQADKAGSILGAYTALAETSDNLGDFFDEMLTAPFGAAAASVLDISEPVGAMMEYFKPGTDAAWSAWIELMMDPGY